MSRTSSKLSRRIGMTATVRGAAYGSSVFTANVLHSWQLIVHYAHLRIGGSTRKTAADFHILCHKYQAVEAVLASKAHGSRLMIAWSSVEK